MEHRWDTDYTGRIFPNILNPPYIIGGKIDSAGGNERAQYQFAENLDPTPATQVGHGRDTGHTCRIWPDIVNSPSVLVGKEIDFAGPKCAGATAIFGKFGPHTGHAGGTQAGRRLRRTRSAGYCKFRFYTSRGEFDLAGATHGQKSPKLNQEREIYTLPMSTLPTFE